MKVLLKIVGVQFAVNADHEAGRPMCEEENQRTIEYLTALKEKKPRVSLLLEPTNEKDPEAIVARVAKAKAGYVCNISFYKRRAWAAIAAAGGKMCRGRVAEVVVGEHGYYTVEVEVPEEATIADISKTDLWQQWCPKVPEYGMTEDWLQGECSLQMLSELVGIVNPTDEDLEEMQDCTTTVMERLRHAPWHEVQMLAEEVLAKTELVHDELRSYIGRQMERLLCGMCNENRMAERRSSWLPAVRTSHEERNVWLRWVYMKSRTEQSLSRKDLKAWLEELQRMLADICAFRACVDGDDADLLSCAYYSGIPCEKFRLLLSVLLLRHEIEERLLVIDTKQNMQSKGLRDLVVDHVLRYAETRNTEDEVNVLQAFIYRSFNYLSPEQKESVDNMTDRFRPKEPVEVTNVYMTNPTNQIETLTVGGDVVENGGNKTVNIVES